MKKSLVQLASIAFLGSIVGKGLRYAINIVIARGLGADALGIFAFGLVIVQAASVLARVGLDQAAQKYVPVFREEGDEDALTGLVFLCVVTPVVIGSVVTLLLYVTMGNIEQLLNTQLSEELRIFLLGIPVLAFFRVTVIATQGFKETKHAVLSRDIVQSIVGISLVAVGAFVLQDIRVVIAAYLLSLVVGGLVATYFIYRHESVHLIPRTVPVRTVFTFSIPLVVVGISSQVVNWSDVFVLGLFVSDADVGRYHAAYQTSLLLTFILSGINAIFPSVASDLYTKNRLAELEELYSGVTKWNFALTMIASATVLVFAPEILSIFDTVTPDAVLALRLLAVAQTITVATGPVGYLLIMSGYERVETANTIIVAILNIGLNIVLVQRYGIVGAALATGSSLALFNIIRVIEVRHFIGILPFQSTYTNAIVPMLVGLLPLVAARMLSVEGIVGLFVSGVVSLALFASAVQVIGLNTSDRALLKSIS